MTKKVQQIAPPPAAERSQAEKDADAGRDRALRAEQYASRKKKRRRGRSMLMFKDEQGVSDTLG